jgi:hypothetical protein
MPNRREFLQTGAAVSAMAVNGVIASGASAVGAAHPMALGRALYDDRYAEGRRFAAVVSAQGIATRTLDGGDITRFFGELEQLWRREPFAVAGFTQFGPMFVVEWLALELGMKIAMRIEHCASSTGALAHRFFGPRETLELAAGSDALHADWPGLTATLACRVCGDDSEWRTGELITPEWNPPRLPSSAGTASFIHYYTPQAEQRGYGPALDGPLHSWVVAPRAQRG